MVMNMFNKSLKWLLIACLVGMLTGSASALFLASLDGVTQLRLTHAWLLWLLPLGGACVSYLYYKYGKDAARGNNLLLDRIYDGNGTVPFRMAPLVLFGTLMTHLFGGSAGREGTAVQMGGTLSDGIGRLFKLDSASQRIVIMCGISSGFGSVFGTPIAGAVFGVEVLALGILSYRAVLPCLIASIVGHYVTLAWGVHHHPYSLGIIPAISGMNLLKVAGAAILFGLTAWLFITLTHKLKAWLSKLIPNLMLRSLIGGIVIIALVLAFGTREYLGIGLPLMERAFTESVTPIAFALKALFTTITLSTGFQGGEVTPLFVIGSTLGSALADILSISVPLLAGIGLISVFSGATNTPIASFIMGIELFGMQGTAIVYMLLGCLVAYLCSGYSGIYSSQKPRILFRRRTNK